MIRSLSVGSGFEDGINFQDYFDAQGIVDAALDRLHAVLGRELTPCCCFELEVAENKARGFHPRGKVVCRTEGVAAPSKVPFDYLVPNHPEWPVLGVADWSSRRSEAQNVPFAIDGKAVPMEWHVQMRVQTGHEYVGYLKVAGLTDHRSGPVPPDDHTVRAAYCATKVFVMSLIASARIEEASTSKVFKERLRVTERAISRQAGHNPCLALRHVADLLTSHLGAGWNRAACYCPVDANTLRCLWAQGGDGSDRWCSNIQKVIAEEVHSVDRLVELAQQMPLPDDDPYFCAAARGNAIDVHGINEPGNLGILARLWRSRGNVSELPSDNLAWELLDVPVRPTTVVDRKRVSQGGAMAAVFNHSDPWIAEISSDRPKTCVFASKNGWYWAFPWFFEKELMAIWVLDMAYWGGISRASDGIPSLVLTDQILRSLAPGFSVHKRRFWRRAP